MFGTTAQREQLIGSAIETYRGLIAVLENLAEQYLQYTRIPRRETARKDAIKSEIVKQEQLYRDLNSRWQSCNTESFAFVQVALEQKLREVEQKLAARKVLGFWHNFSGQPGQYEIAMGLCVSLRPYGTLPAPLYAELHTKWIEKQKAYPALPETLDVLVSLQPRFKPQVPSSASPISSQQIWSFYRGYLKDMEDIICIYEQMWTVS